MTMVHLDDNGTSVGIESNVGAGLPRTRLWIALINLIRLL